MRITAENHESRRITRIMEPSRHPGLTVQPKSPSDPKSVPDGLVINCNGAMPYRAGLRENRRYIINLTRDELIKIVECALKNGLIERAS